MFLDRNIILKDISRQNEKAAVKHDDRRQGYATSEEITDSSIAASHPAV